MKNNFPKAPLILSLTFFMFLSGAAIFSYQTINGNNQKAEQELATWTAEAHRRDNIISLNHSLQQNAPEEALLQAHFARSSDIVPFLDTIEKLAGAAGVVAEMNSVDTGADNSKLVIGLKASGSFGAIYKFLTLLENSPYELDFLSMDLHKMSSDTAGKTAISKWEAVFLIQLLSFIP